MSWTDDRVERLKKLWANGLSASQVAANLGGVTRNAVIGKIHRLGLSGRAKPAMCSGAKSKAKVHSSGYSRIKHGSAKVSRRDNSKNSMRTAPGSMERMKDSTAPEPKRYQLIELSEKTCKWPIGDPQDADFCFCGHTVKESDPYCDYHCKLAYQPVTMRRRAQKTNI